MKSAKTSYLQKCSWLLHNYQQLRLSFTLPLNSVAPTHETIRHNYSLLDSNQS